MSRSLVDIFLAVDGHSSALSGDEPVNSSLATWPSIETLCNRGRSAAVWYCTVPDSEHLPPGQSVAQVTKVLSVNPNIVPAVDGRIAVIGQVRLKRNGGRSYFQQSRLKEKIDRKSR